MQNDLKREGVGEGAIAYKFSHRASQINFNLWRKRAFAPFNLHTAGSRVYCILHVSINELVYSVVNAIIIVIIIY